MGNSWSKFKCFGSGSSVYGSGNSHGSGPSAVSHSISSARHEFRNNRSNPSISIPHLQASSSPQASTGQRQASSSPQTFTGQLQPSGSPPASIGPLQPSSSPPASTGQLQPQSSPQASTSSPSPDLEFTVKEIADLEAILDYILTVINRYKRQSDPPVIPQGVVSNNLNEADNLLDRISKALGQKEAIMDAVNEAQIIASTVLRQVGDLHWAAAGLSMVALTLDRANQMSANKEHCLSILEDLGNLSKNLVILLQKGLPNAEDKLRDAIFLLLEGVMWCDTQMKSSRFKRFMLANVSKEYLEALKARVNQLYQDLNFVVDIEIHEEVRSVHRQMTKPLDPYKAPYPTDAVGLGEKVSKILEEQLGVSGDTIEPGVRAILLYGMGGIGKTTFGKAICAEIPITGRFVAQVELGEKPTSEKICSVQMDMYERLTGSRERIGSYGEGQEKLQKYLSECKSPVLLFIDSVFTQKDLGMLLPDKLHLPDKSRLVVASRDSSVSEILSQGTVEWKKHEVRQLEPSDSRELFDRHVGGRPHGKEEQINAILEICGGLPLALEVVGKHLKVRDRKNKSGAWKSAIDSLRSSRSVTGRAEDDLSNVLRWSYDQLDENAKKLFLDICCLLRDADWDWLNCLGSESEVGILKDLSLVKEVERIEEEFGRFTGFLNVYSQAGSNVEVHDLLAALGKDKSEPSRRISINHEDTLHEFLDDNQQDHTLDGLVLQLPYRDKDGNLINPYCFPASKLDAMHHSLRILALDGPLEFWDTCEHIPRQLHICSIRSKYARVFPYTDISHLSKLRVLDINGTYGSGISCDFQDVQLPESLKILQLAVMKDLRVFHSDAFKKCTSLHRLSISWCEDLEGLPPSFCLLEELCQLKLQYNLKIEILPDFGALQSLEAVYIESSAEQIPTGIDKLSKLRQLLVTGVEGLPNDLGFSHVTSLADPDLNGASDAIPAEELPKGLGNLIALETLELCVSDVDELPPGLGCLTNLQRLFLNGFEKLKTLPDTIGFSHKLEFLSLSGCIGVKELPTSLGNLVALQKLDLSRCLNLETLPDSVTCLKNLTEVNMCGCFRLRKLPNDFGNLIALEILNLDRCENLEALPDSICHLKSLTELYMTECSKLIGLPNDFGNLVGLQILYLDKCENLESLPKSIVSLTNLTLVSMSGCSRLEKWPNEFGNLEALDELYLGGCEAA